MIDNGTSTIRVLTVILTHERLYEFERAVCTAFATLCPQDLLVVLDDSSPSAARTNADLLAKTAGSWPATPYFHIHADQFHMEVARAAGGVSDWQRRASRRDIAPLRNLSLLISAVVTPQTTVLIDDDICDFDVSLTSRLCDEADRVAEGLITGATIGGFTDLDTITRLSNAIQLLESNSKDLPTTTSELFRMPPIDDGGAQEVGCLSAGYMAFRLHPAMLFAFPPGYNEDWLWCVMQMAAGQCPVLRTKQVVFHEPRSLREPTRDDILFEVSGDLVFDCMVEQSNGRRRGPETLLAELSGLNPQPSVMPSLRVETISNQFRALAERRTGPHITNLKRYGFGVLEQMLCGGDVQIDGQAMLTSWSADALAKHRSFSATIKSATVLTTVRKTLSSRRM